MAIINQLEKQPRGVYCGMIGICLLNGDAIFNIGICTIQKLGNQAIYGAGGGITWGVLVMMSIKRLVIRLRFYIAINLTLTYSQSLGYLISKWWI